MKGTLARGLLSNTEPSLELFPTSRIPARREQALKKYADALARDRGA